MPTVTEKIPELIRQGNIEELVKLTETEQFSHEQQGREAQILYISLREIGRRHPKQMDEVFRYLMPAARYTDESPDDQAISVAIEAVAELGRGTETILLLSEIILSSGESARCSYNGSRQEAVVTGLIRRANAGSVDPIDLLRSMSGCSEVCLHLNGPRTSAKDNTFYLRMDMYGKILREVNSDLRAELESHYMVKKEAPQA